jgi:hypothetical protein
MPTPAAANTFDQKNLKIMKNKTKTVLTRTFTGLITFIIVMSAASKLAFVPQLVDIFSKIGLLSYIKILGMTELLFLSIFIWKKTRKLGLLLLTGYFGGAMAVEMSHGTFFIAPATILALIWVTAYLFDEKMFISERKEASTSLSTPSTTAI